MSSQGNDLKSIAFRMALPFVGTLIVFAISLFFAVGVDDGDLGVRVFWPERLSASTTGKLVVVVRDQGQSNSPPVSGARVTLFQAPSEGRSAYLSRRDKAQQIMRADSLRKIGEVTTDVTGNALIQLPPVTRDAQGQGLRRTDDRSLALIVKVSYKGEDRTLRQTFEPPQEARLVVTSDRPLYQPGQKILLKALGIEPDSGKPIAGAVSWEARDPRGNLVLQESGQLTDAGIAQAELPLSPRCVQGVYRIRAIHASGGTAEMSVDVRPFRLPRFKVQVTPDSGRIKPGEALAGKVQATYTYGDPVADQEVAMQVVFTKTNQRTETAEIKGRTDLEGTFRFSWDMPRDVAVGRAIELQAIVTSEAGRAERGKSQVRVGANRIKVEVLAAGSAGWLMGRSGAGFVIVTDGGGKPLQNAKVTLRLPEQRQEKTVEVTTDAQGHAVFTWTPQNTNTPARITVEGPEGERLEVDRRISVNYGDLTLEAESPTASVGQPYTIQLYGATGEGLTLVALSRGYPVAAAPIGQGSQRATLTFGPESRGMVLLRAYSLNGQQRATLPIWVVQGGGDKVDVKLDASTYKPGAEATIDLAFAPTANPDDTPPVSPVAFGVVAVDEALYALKERTNQPLAVLLRESPGRVAQVAGALAELDGVDQDDEISKRIAATRFSRRFSNNDQNWNNGDDLTLTIAKLNRQPWVEGWALILALLILGLAFMAARATMSIVTREAFGLGRAGALLGVAFVGLVCAGIMASASPEMLVGGLMVWGGVVICWSVATAWRNPEMTLSAWLWAILGMILMALAIALSMSDNGRVSEWVAWALLFALGLPAVLLAIEILLWGFALHAKGLRKPAFGLITIFGIAGGAALGMTMMSVGGSYDSVMEQKTASAPMVARMDDMGAEMAEEEDADMPVATKSPAKPKVEGGPRVREFFPETMIWIPELRSDGAGKAQIKAQVPDSITTWRLDATATTWDGRFGDAQAAMRVWKPFFVELELPTDLTAGDRIEVPVAVVNNSEDIVLVNIEAKGEGVLAVEESPSAPVRMEGGQRSIVILKVKATKAGSGGIVVTARPSRGEGDAVRRTARVRPDGRALTRTHSGVIAKGWRAELNVPTDALDGSVSASAAVFPSAVSDALDGLAGMLRGPTGCFEQTSSANYPNVMVLRALKQTAPDKWPGGQEKWEEARVKARKHLALGYQRILSFQLNSGAFSLYNDRQSTYTTRRPDIMLTAYGIVQLAEMATVYPVDPRVIERAAAWLAGRQNDIGTWPVFAGRAPGGTWRDNGDAAQLRSTAFVTWALLKSPVADRHKGPLAKALDHLAKQSGESGAPDTLALTISALHAGGRKADAERLADRLVAQISRQDDLAWWSMSWASWMGGRGRYANIEATALAASALLEVEKHGEQLQPALRYLAQARSPYGGWGTTQATVWTLRTFETLRALESGGPVTLSVYLGGQPWAAEVPNGALGVGKVEVEPGDALVQRFSSGTMGTGESLVLVAATDSTAAMAQATARYAAPWTSPRAQVSGERLKIAATTNFKTLDRGDALEVTAKVRNPTRDAYGASIVELPLPPGAFADPDQFEAWQKAGLIDTFEILPTHVRVYLSGFKPLSQREFVYRFKVLIRGEFSLPPVRAYVFYAPEPITEVDGGDLLVR